MLAAALGVFFPAVAPALAGADGHGERAARSGIAQEEAVMPGPPW